MVVTLDPRSVLRLRGRATWKASWDIAPLRLRFLDMEPEEVFVRAARGSTAGEFLKLWHRALAPGRRTASTWTVRALLSGGPNADFVDLRLLGAYLQEMVKMSPLQGSYFRLCRRARIWR